jgi:hypothetical protein
VVTCDLVLRTTTVGLALGLFAGATAQANPAGVVPSAAYPGDALHIRADYEYDIDNALITREHVGDADADPLAPLPRHRELEFHQTRHLFTPQAELGIYHGLWLSFAVPIVLGQARELSLASGVDRAHSSTFTDGILTGTGFDAHDPSTPPIGNVVFRGVNRVGVRELRGGLGLALMNQASDPTKPTWKLGVEGRFAVGRVMRFDPIDPSRETGVSTGVHELRVWTSVDRRFHSFEGWFEAFWQLPIHTRNASLFKDPGFGTTNVELGQTAGASFGLEAYVINDPEIDSRLSLDVGARMTAHFEGRGYSEMWEVFALAGDRRMAGPLVLDSDPTAAGQQALSYPGISNLESYLETAGRFAMRAKLGTHVTFAALGEVIWKTDHAITFADAGVDLPTCPSGAPRCETDANDLVNPGTQEVNPLHARKIDLVGHRYRSEDNHGYVLGAEVQILF